MAETQAQNFSRWFVDWPSTHRLAGQTVEVVPAAVAERLAEALREIERRASRSTRRGNPLVLEILDVARAALSAYEGNPDA